MDSTSSIQLCKCGCGEEIIKPKGATFKLYVNDDHIRFHKRLEKLRIEREEIKNGWKLHHIAMSSKFFELVGDKKAKCNICGKTYSENLAEHNLPLKCELKEGVRDYRVLDFDHQWNFYCLKCYVEITFIKENKQSN